MIIAQNLTMLKTYRSHRLKQPHIERETFLSDIDTVNVIALVGSSASPIMHQDDDL